MALRRNRGDEPLDDGHDGLSSTLVPNKPLKDVQSRGFARLFMVVLVAGFVATFVYFRTLLSKRDDETRTVVHTLESSFAKVQDEMKQMATELEERKRMLEEKQKGDKEKGERLTSTLPYPEAGTVSPVSLVRVCVPVIRPLMQMRLSPSWRTRSRPSPRWKTECRRYDMPDCSSALMHACLGLA